MRTAAIKLARRVRSLLRAVFPRLMLARAQAKISHWSEVEEDLLPVMVDRQRDAVDVGAYVGTYTMALAGLARQVHTFEPDAELARLLRRAAPGNVTVRTTAVAEAEGTSEFHVPAAGGRRAVTCGSLIAPADEAYEVRRVPTTTLDAALGSADIGFMKIDVEGAEESVLRGAREVIDRCRPVILLEANTPDALATLAEYFAPLDYAGFFVRDARTFPLDEYRPDMQDPNLMHGPAQRRQMGFLNNFFFAPAAAAPGLRQAADQILAGQHSHSAA